MIDPGSLERIYSSIGQYIDPITGQDLTLQAAIYVANELEKQGITNFSQIESRVIKGTPAKVELGPTEYLFLAPWGDGEVRLAKSGWDGPEYVNANEYELGESYTPYGGDGGGYTTVAARRKNVTPATPDITKYYNKNTGQEITNRVLLDDKAGTKYTLTDQGLQKDFDPIQKLAVQLRPYVDSSSTGGAWGTKAGRDSPPGFGPEGMMRQIAQRFINATGVSDINDLELATKNIPITYQVEKLYDWDTGKEIYKKVLYGGGGEGDFYTELLTPEELQNVKAERFYDYEGGGWSYKYSVDSTVKQQGIYNKKTGQLLASENRSPFAGMIYGGGKPTISLGGWGEGPGLTYGSITFGDNGKPKIYTSGEDTNTLSDLGPILAIASLVPSPIQPFAIAANALIALDQGDVLGAVASVAGLAGLNEVAAVARVAKAVESGDILGAALAAATASGAGNVELADGVSVNDVLRVSKAADAISKGDFGTALVLAGQQFGSQELIKAGQGVQLAKAIASGNPSAIADATGQVMSVYSSDAANAAAKNEGWTGLSEKNIAINFYGPDVTPDQWQQFGQYVDYGIGEAFGSVGELESVVDQFKSITGSEPSAQQIQGFRDVGDGSVVRGFNLSSTTQEEAKAFLEANGYKPTDNEAAAFAGFVTESNAKANIAEYVDPRQVTEAEAREFLEANGYTPTEDEIKRFVGQVNEDTARANIAGYVDPRQVTEAEAREFLEANGYTPTDAEIRQFIGQITEDAAKANIAGYVDPRQVTEAEAREFLEANGYTPTDAEIRQFIGQITEDATKANIAGYVDPRQVTEAEAIQVLTDLGVDPESEYGKDLIAEYTRQGDETQLIDQLTAGADSFIRTPKTVGDLLKLATNPVAYVLSPISGEISKLVTGTITNAIGADNLDTQTKALIKTASAAVVNGAFASLLGGDFKKAALGTVVGTALNALPIPGTKDLFEGANKDLTFNQIVDRVSTSALSAAGLDVDSKFGTRIVDGTNSAIRAGLIAAVAGGNEKQILINTGTAFLGGAFGNTKLSKDVSKKLDTFGNELTEDAFDENGILKGLDPVDKIVVQGKSDTDTGIEEATGIVGSLALMKRFTKDDVAPVSGGSGQDTVSGGGGGGSTNLGSITVTKESCAAEGKGFNETTNQCVDLVDVIGGGQGTVSGGSGQDTVSGGSGGSSVTVTATRESCAADGMGFDETTKECVYIGDFTGGGQGTVSGGSGQDTVSGGSGGSSVTVTATRESCAADGMGFDETTKECVYIGDFTGGGQGTVSGGSGQDTVSGGSGGSSVTITATRESCAAEGKGFNETTNQCVDPVDVIGGGSGQGTVGGGQDTVGGGQDTVGGGSVEVTSCGPGKTRDPETGLCLETVKEDEECPPGQVDTGFGCQDITAGPCDPGFHDENGLCVADTDEKPPECPAGEVRNLNTGLCEAVQPDPCPAGYKRNAAGECEIQVQYQSLPSFFGIDNLLRNRGGGAGYSPNLREKFTAVRTYTPPPEDYDYFKDDYFQRFGPISYVPPENYAGAGKAEGGLMSLAKGGRTSLPPRYLDGHSDGMADQVPASIDNSRPAALSDGEFVIPADVVSHLGNGNSNAGAKVLYEMMDRIRRARTGNSKQGKQINPSKFIPR